MQDVVKILVSEKSKHEPYLWGDLAGNFAFRFIAALFFPRAYCIFLNYVI